MVPWSRGQTPPGHTWLLSGVVGSSQAPLGLLFSTLNTPSSLSGFSEHFRPFPALHSLQPLSVFPEVRGPNPARHSRCVQRDSHCPAPAGHTIPAPGQDVTVGLDGAHGAGPAHRMIPWRSRFPGAPERPSRPPGKEGKVAVLPPACGGRWRDAALGAVPAMARGRPGGVPAIPADIPAVSRRLPPMPSRSPPPAAPARSVGSERRGTGRGAVPIAAAAVPWQRPRSVCLRRSVTARTCPKPAWMWHLRTCFNGEHLNRWTR